MKIVIAGGTGYLGRLLTKYYAKERENQIYQAKLCTTHLASLKRHYLLGINVNRQQRGRQREKEREVR